MAEKVKDQESINQIIEAFSQISEIPRGSGSERGISLWLQNWAKEHGFACKADEVYNVVMSIPASKGCEHAPTIVIQGHMDMVCQKTPDSAHDFERDPITFVRDGDWLKADGTTLGADNGIALAMAITAATRADLSHPPLELLFTVDEEVAMGGALNLQPGFVAGRILLNLDSEQEGMFTIGCAGGRTSEIVLPLRYRHLPQGGKLVLVRVDGLKGGHSGDDIVRQRGNASKILINLLSRFSSTNDIGLVQLEGGTVTNAITRSAHATLTLVDGDVSAFRAQVSSFSAQAKREFPNEPNLTIEFTELTKVHKDFAPLPYGYYTDAATPSALSRDDTLKVIDLLLALPDGVERMSKSIEGLVETSNNIGIVSLSAKGLRVVSNQRSSSRSRLDALTARIEAIGRMSGAEVRHSNAYPGWDPDIDSPLLKRCLDVYREAFGQNAGVESCHAGLECGVIGSRYEGMDMISFGPTIRDPHSPDERLDLVTVGQVWQFMVKLLASYADGVFEKG